MFLHFDDLNDGLAHDVAVVGSGPLGLAAGLAMARRGFKVLLLESGREQPDPASNDLGRGLIDPPGAHVALEEACCRSFGGTSHWWGGRCIPFEPIDFTARDWMGCEGWPITHGDVAPYYEPAAAFMQCGPPVFSMEAPWKELIGLRFDTLERWVPHPRLPRMHGREVAKSADLSVVLGATVTGFELSADTNRVTSLTVKSAHGVRRIASPRVILACGGVQTPRLLLSVQRSYPRLFGGEDGPLGRYHMGHIFGRIADMAMVDPGHCRRMDFFVHEGRYVRRRFTLPEAEQVGNRLPQIIFTAGNAAIGDPSHRNGILSLMWLALASPLGRWLLSPPLRKHYLGDTRGRVMDHLANVARTLPSTAVGGARLIADRFLSSLPKPGHIIWNGGGRYAIFYHAEQSPEARNRITLSGETDALGLPRAVVSFRYRESDAAAIVRAHEVLATAFEKNNIARLTFRDDAFEDRAARVLAQARDGYHQMGAARMSADPRQGVVDRDCKVHGVANLYVASTCVFPSSGHANPTFLGVALALV